MEKKIGSYQIVRTLGKGGMGDVFLARDPICRRIIALKRIRTDLSHNKIIQDRFLREAKIAAQLSHPSIIPIYAIYEEGDKSYYTMPYVEGETLKQILRTTREQEKAGEKLHPIGGSIPALIRIFLTVCQATAYTHSKGILHRDLKPENIIIGTYGEVMILDWGLADFIDRPETILEEDLDDALFKDLTHPGKIAGTITYLPPERAMGEAPTVQLDIYALGVILYQLLTLRLPFQRATLQQFRKMAKHEQLIDPTEAAPYRDIPLQLADIAKKCLAPSKEHRFQSVEALIAEVQNYIEGSPEWIPAGTLSVDKKSDWAFQENILLAKHIAITRSTDVMEWVVLMISKAAFSGNLKMEALVKLNTGSKGIGLLFNVPEAGVKKGLEEGYCLWLDSSIKLFRANIEVMHIPDASLSKDVWHKIRIEKIDNHLRFFLNGALVLDYLSHIPVAGSHVGLIYRDADFEMEEMKIFVGSQNLTVSCLAIPDAFLANKEYAKALSEYRRIGYSFPGRAEGREGLFRAGLTLLAEAESSPKKSRLYAAALDEFGKLHATPGAPLEYLGKSLVYKACKDTEEEIKCLELTLRKYKKHPLLPILIEHIAFRLHESSYYDRTAAYHYALLAIRHLPEIFSNPDHARLISSLSKHLEPLPFLTPTDHSLATALAFWLGKPRTLRELLDGDRENVLFSLLELGCYEDLKGMKEVKTALVYHKGGLEKALEQLKTVTESKELLHIFQCALDEQKAGLILPFLEKLPRSKRVDEIHISALLFLSRFDEAGELLESYALEERLSETSPLFFLFGCWLFATEGREIAIAHFDSGSDLSYPPTSALLSYYLRDKVDIKKLLFWEKVQLFRQLALFYHCTEENDKVNYFLKRLKREVSRVRSSSRNFK